MATTHHNIAIILPAYNEELTIGGTIEGFHGAIPEARIYVVDNNSNDNTAVIAEKTLKTFNISGAVLHEARQGKGNAVRRAFLEVDADIYVMADADMTYPPAQVRELIQPIIDGRADMVNGDRHSGGDYAAENDRPLHNLGNNLVQKLVNSVSGASVIDIMTGYRALSRTFVETYPILVEGFQLETDMTIFALQSRFRIIEVPIRYVNRPAGSYSKLNTCSDGLRVLRTILNLFRHYKPLVFFSIAAIILALSGMVLGIPVIMEFMATGYVSHIPLAILASGIEIIAVVTFGIGLTLDSIAYHRRIDIENMLHKNTLPYYKASDHISPIL